MHKKEGWWLFRLMMELFAEAIFFHFMKSRRHSSFTQTFTEGQGIVSFRQGGPLLIHSLGITWWKHTIRQCHLPRSLEWLCWALFCFQAYCICFSGLRSCTSSSRHFRSIKHSVHEQRSSQVKILWFYFLPFPSSILLQPEISMEIKWIALIWQDSTYTSIKWLFWGYF